MNVNGQHEMHPGAETLSAFTEQALSAKERGEVLAHLAVCGRCRQLVALAREAAGVEVAARHGAARPRAWWKSWGLALVPAAAVVATGVIAFYVHERAMERTSDVAKLEQQRASEKTVPAPQALPEPLAPAAPAAPTTRVDVPATPRAPARSTETERPGEVRREPATEPDETASAPPAAPAPEALNGPAPERERYSGSPAGEIHGAMENAYAPTRAPADDKTPSEVAVYDEERKKQAEEAAEERHRYAAKAAAPSSLQNSKVGETRTDKTRTDETRTDETRTDKTVIDNAGSAPAESRTAPNNEQVEVDAQQPEPQPAPDFNSGELKSPRLSGFSGALMATPIHLPSGLPVLSVASSDHRVLAIDKKGSLYFSEDSGLTWEKVKRQWTDRAILVRKKNSEDAAPPAATVPESSEGASVSNALSHPETVFELVNDQSEMWLSADGRNWTAK